MEYSNGTFTYYASDLSTHVSCKHASQLNRQAALKELDKIFRDDPLLEVLKKRGLEHEERYVEYLHAKGKSITDSTRKTFAETVRQMQAGTEVIVQGRLEHGNYHGFPDILIKIPGRSIFGDWQYEVQDTKLSTNTRTSTIIQLCFYTELLHMVQKGEPGRFYVVKAGEEAQEAFEIDEYYYSDFKAYYSFLKSQFKDSMDRSPIETYPEEVEHCSICNWWSNCNDRRRKDDHLSLVAGIRKSQIEDLKKQSIATLESFANAPALTPPPRGNFEALVKRQLQAKIQFEGRVVKDLVHKPLIPVEEKRGFSRLPQPSKGDVYFDIEGDAFFPGGSLEYLFGLAYYEENNLRYECFWATTRNEERIAFQKLMDFILNRYKRFPDFAIYHYGAYEPSTVKRLAHRYVVAEQELDDLLRKEKFVDLHTVVKESLIASVEQYSLKDIEKFAKYTRLADLREAGKARKQIESSLQLNEFHKIPADTVELVRVYNQDDCFATQALHKWLEVEREKLIKEGQNILRPTIHEEPPSEKLLQLEHRSKLLFEALTKGLPAKRDDWADEHQAKWLLANQLQYFRRENKTAWWEHYRLQKGEYDDLLRDRKAIVGLTFLKTVTPGDIPVHQYSFPVQEVSLKAGDSIHIVNSFSKEKPSGISCGKIVEIDTEKNLVTIKKTGETADTHPDAVHHYDIIDVEILWKAILAIATEVDDNGMTRMGEYRAAKDLLMKRKPQLNDRREGAHVLPGEEIVKAASRLALDLNKSILPIQGPPGTGKTYTGAHVIIDLIRKKKRVGVTAVSHRVITTLFEAVNKEAEKRGINISFTHKITNKIDDMPSWVAQQKDKKKVRKAIDQLHVTGGTAWLWADDDFRESLDYLIVDEAGQMSLTQVLAASRSAKNIILLGDPQQLEQPQRGAHPENSGVAALTHLLDGDVVMPKEKGLFINVTRRINLAIAEFTSEIFYKGQLRALEELKNQVITGTKDFDGGGLYYVPVNHKSSNADRSIEEVENIKAIVAKLLKTGSWSDEKCKVARLTEKDILIVAPFNAQVDALKDALPNLDIGTVDKFQGREAPVVIYSMASTSVNEAPRGLNFLFNPNRLNVATSRAKCICIMVASPFLFEAECNTIEQMRWANAMCRYREMSRVVEL